MGCREKMFLKRCVFLNTLSIAQGLTLNAKMEDFDLSIIDKYLPQLECRTTQDPTKEICPQLYQCFHQGHQIRPGDTVQNFEDCEEYHCICAEEIAPSHVACKTGYQHCQWVYEGCGLMKRVLVEGICLEKIISSRRSFLKLARNHH